MGKRQGLTYDKILKAIFSNPVCIRQLMQAYVCPFELCEALDFSSMQQIGTEFVDMFAQSVYYGDMLWEIGFKDRSRKPLYLVLMLELQSSSCYHMALRMLNYTTQFYFRLLGKSASRQAFPLPKVVPIVFYTGWPRWQGPQDVSELIDSSGLLGGIPSIKSKYILIDVFRTVPKGEANSLIWLLVDCLRTNDIDKLRQKWFNLQKVLPDLGHPIYQEAWIQLMGMICRSLKEVTMSAELTIDTVYPHVTKEDIDDLLDADGNVINWRKRCHDQGRVEGRAEGLAEGRTETMVASLKSLMETMNLTVDNAMNALRVPEAERNNYRQALGADSR